MVTCQDIVQEWLAKHYRCYGTRQEANRESNREQVNGKVREST